MPPLPPRPLLLPLSIFIIPHYYITHDLSPVTSSNTPALLMTSWLLYILRPITSLFFNTVTDDLRGRNVLHYHPFTLLRDCSVSARPHHTANQLSAPL